MKLRVALAVVALALVYVATTFAQVVLASRRDGARRADAILVLGAAQYDGRPSPVLRARLDHAARLYDRRLAPVIVVTGGRQPGDRFSEAQASARYLQQRHDVPGDAVVWEPYGDSSWAQIASAARFLKRRGMEDVMLVSDPFHSARIGAIADDQGLQAAVSPTRTSPIGGVEQVPYFARETAALALGRILGHRQVAWLAGR
ncbi:MAG TPA: YdcF family protein [Acidimicrobiales bacterium]|nr:YdcF family protein [Acidimicrobiales bacterium]